MKPFFSMTNKLNFLLVCLTTLICNITISADASLVNFVVEGRLNHVNTELEGAFFIGDLYHLEYTVDSTVLDVNPDGPDKAAYLNAITSLTVTVGDYYTASSSGQTSITVFNDDPYDADLYRIDIQAESMIGDDVGRSYLHNQGPLLYFGDVNGSAISDDSLIPYTLDRSNYSGYVGLTFWNPFLSPLTGPVSISANISSFEFYPVPVPSTSLFLFSGIVGVFGIGRFHNFYVF